MEKPIKIFAQSANDSNVEERLNRNAKTTDTSSKKDPPVIPHTSINAGPEIPFISGGKSVGELIENV
ncbi:hypothetical protein [uncultured Gimesia sp.]|uniref:hypothetical protein n=1 Tax=uncultured Gimesia sp. TaxID=1678688 RepID=UPI0026075720|nr:hypothetical protein [uncultured Gimesia sp.]